MILWLFGCATPKPPEWTDAAITAGVRAELDTDKNGRIEATEYEATRWNGAPFGSADTDGDGALSTAELTVLLTAQSASAFDGGMPEPARQHAPLPLLNQDQRRVWEVLLWLADTLRAAGRPVPDPAAIDRAVQSGSFRSPETLGVLEAMRSAWTDAGWMWPLAALPADIDPSGILPVPLVDADPNAEVERRLSAAFDWGPAGPPQPASTAPAPAAPPNGGP